MHSILRQQEAQFVAVGGCGCLYSFVLFVLYCVECVKSSAVVR